jgi:O-acetylhomoserine/O-acetylserine sulfhydrylase-like pyridoxal-dependent enzyme
VYVSTRTGGKYTDFEVDSRKVTWKIRWIGKDNIDRRQKNVREKTGHRDV